jgi:solute carrier family 35 protein F1/2
MVPIHQDEAVLDYAAVGAGYVHGCHQYKYSKTCANCITTVLAICITSTNTLSTLLNNEGTSIPAFQSFFNYVLLNLIYTSYTIYKYGFKRWVRLCIFEGWRFFILAFFDVEGNYFVVLAYRYVSL